METFLLILQAVLSAILIALILVQNKGTGFGRAWGSNTTSFTRRGLEKLIFRASFFIAGAFVLVSIISIVV